MPSAMIHLLAAHEMAAVSAHANAPDLFWVGNFAPDYTNDRLYKDSIHYRNVPDRLSALEGLARRLDRSNPFEMGWLLHLYVDYLWDSSMITAYRAKYEPDFGPDWFPKYRQETNLASFRLFHEANWSAHVWEQILSADLSELSRVLPVTAPDVENYRERVYRRHADSDKASCSDEYDDARVTAFACEAAQSCARWLGRLSE